MRSTRWLVLAFIAIFTVGIATSACAVYEEDLYIWWTDKFGVDSSWDTEGKWVENYVLNSENGTWRSTAHQDPDDPGSGYDLQGYIWDGAWQGSVRIEAEYAGLRWRDANSFGIYDITDDDDVTAGGDWLPAGKEYTLLSGDQGPGSSAWFVAPEGQFLFYLDSSKEGSNINGGVWFSDPSLNAPVYDGRGEPDNGSAEVADPYMQAVVMKHPTAAWGGWIIGWSDVDVSQGEYMFGSRWGIGEPDGNDMIVTVEKTPELPPSALIGLGALPLGWAYIRGRWRRDGERRTAG